MSTYTISESEAIAITTNYRENHTDLVRAFKIDKAEIDLIFNDPNAAGIRTYLGKDSNGLRLVMVGVDSNGDDILGTYYDHCDPCPSNCDNNSILNNGE